VPNAEEWGKGYDFGQIGMMKAIKTAEELGAYRERDRIIKLLEDESRQCEKAGLWANGTELRGQLQELHLGLNAAVALIKGENE
jgi:hypothetical protein